MVYTFVKHSKLLTVDMHSLLLVNHTLIKLLQKISKSFSLFSSLKKYTVKHLNWNLLPPTFLENIVYYFNSSLFIHISHY